MTKSDSEGYRFKLMRSAHLIMAAVAFLLSSTAVPQQQPLPREQLKQYVADLQKNPSDYALREKIIKLALTLDPKPALPPEVDELAGRGEYIMQHATSDADLQSAADAFAKASLIAPWMPDYYFDQGMVWEKAKNYDKAVKNFELYLLGVPPDSDDARKARQHLGGLKYELDKQHAAEAAANARRQAELQAEMARQREAQAALQRQQEADRARLARLSPLVRSLDGAVYRLSQHDSTGNWFIFEYRISGASALRQTESNIGDPHTQEFQIEGDEIVVPIEARDCNAYWNTSNCYNRGKITEKEISFETWVDGVSKGRLNMSGGVYRRVK